MRIVLAMREVIRRMSNLVDRARFWRDHRWAPPHMSDFLDQSLAAQGRERMGRHVAECSECRRLLAGLGVIVDGLHRLPAPGGGAGAVQITASVRRRLREPPRP
jgi:anti-sigma factor RsiW